ncbi:MAG: DUF4209 domain-containing protein [Planctomycetaceae bacterium]|nr:DUF4209 domain-containing protein [Planctomycetaceae bacterium]
MLDLKDDFIAHHADGAIVKISLTIIRKPGSYQQLKTVFGLAIATILRVFDDRGMDLRTFLDKDTIPPGIPVNKDVMKAYLYAVAGYVGDDGDSKTLSEMDSTERSRFFENIRTTAAAQWHIQIPDPDIHWKEKAHKEQEHEK